ncbi:MAG: hypothetical protein FPO08_06680 [Geobacter sp.]|nr:MAG: hypothetical protein FPO08_06680 [Geobacter sp.]
MMKKIITAAALLLAMQGLAYAAGTLTGGPLSSTGISFTPSNNVKVFYFSDGQNYTINSKHDAGDRKYSTSNKTSNIWWIGATSGTALTASDVPTTVAGETDAGYVGLTGWSAQ